MNHEQMMAKHKDLFSDDQGVSTCAYIEAPTTYLLLIDLLLSEISYHLQEKTVVEPFYITRIYLRDGKMRVEAEGATAATKGMISMACTLSSFISEEETSSI
jgi:hypothetical protein